jgi:hypothetical protein
MGGPLKEGGSTGRRGRSPGPSPRTCVAPALIALVGVGDLPLWGANSLTSAPATRKAAPLHRKSATRVTLELGSVNV